MQLLQFGMQGTQVEFLRHKKHPGGQQCPFIKVNEDSQERQYCSSPSPMQLLQFGMHGRQVEFLTYKKNPEGQQCPFIKVNEDSQERQYC
jgi:tRNA/tmRNA/rRNA uracil-C5-methylase (TrmA/RlmC/RlmD family)